MFCRPRGGDTARPWKTWCRMRDHSAEGPPGAAAGHECSSQPQSFRIAANCTTNRTVGSIPITVESICVTHAQRVVAVAATDVQDVAAVERRDVLRDPPPLEVRTPLGVDVEAANVERALAPRAETQQEFSQAARSGSFASICDRISFHPVEIPVRAITEPLRRSAAPVPRATIGARSRRNWRKGPPCRSSQRMATNEAKLKCLSHDAGMPKAGRFQAVEMGCRRLRGSRHFRARCACG